MSKNAWITRDPGSFSFARIFSSRSSRPIIRGNDTIKGSCRTAHKPATLLRNHGTIFFLWIAINCLSVVVSSSSVTGNAKLGDRCTGDEDCIAGSHCRFGSCRCTPYFAQYNETICLEATLLGEECFVDEQCSLKVANSGCFDGLCGCKQGFLQFRRHTCLKPAKLGEVCYNHGHCRLWQENSHCDFLIPDLFGRCRCSAPMRRENDVCKPDNLIRPPLLRGQSVSIATDVVPTIDEDRTTEDHRREESVTDIPIPWPSRDESQENSTMPADGDDDDTIVVEAVEEESSTTTKSIAEWVLDKGAEKTDRHEPSAATPVSLGLDCVSDVECRLADQYSRCIEGVCDCGFNFYGNSTCTAKKRGCAPGTFQCTSSGACISWFFVCDGRPDCSDGSDERCSDRETECPSVAFRCGKSGTCVSRASLCNGVRDCPHGEDEIGCNNRRKCPEGAFRCNNGQCLPGYEFCNAVVSCRDGSDEPRGACQSRNRGRVSARYCPFVCDNGRCRSDAIACSGRDGCGDGSDEKRCSVCRCPRIP
ncbi:ecdysone-inducible gene E1 [Lasioglossum baleicum]|uniref:ecdysone-inducible gene E1 n=1 Tax=Lasioglossum baleicum TaxID=434251 RepID=UPI003FCEAB9D